MTGFIIYREGSNAANHTSKLLIDALSASGRFYKDSGTVKRTLFVKAYRTLCETVFGDMPTLKEAVADCRRFCDKW